ncbi:MAG: 30S ribosomal protein S4 [Deltaproteobacteria bacterium]|nr:30S ribosomal protein S4 [Deltaproteobacteria bacterium]
MNQSKCKICRRLNEKLFLKGDRCLTDKCSFDRRSYPPGQHGQGRGKVSEYALQLREKQKVKRTYGLMEGQFRSLFKKADRVKGVTGENLMSYLERRLDNAVHLLGLTSSRSEARMLVCHGLFMVNGIRVNIPSYMVKVNDVIEVAEKSKKVARFATNLKASEKRSVPEWLSLDAGKLQGTIKRLPVRDDVTMPVQEQLIVELYSK